MILSAVHIRMPLRTKETRFARKVARISLLQLLELTQRHKEWKVEE